MPHLLRISTIIAIFAFVSSCRKLVDVPSPINSTTGASVFQSDATATAVLTGIYSSMSSSSFSSSGGFLSLSLFPGLSADELTLYGGDLDPAYNGYYKNALTNTNTGGDDYWVNLYPVIYVANSAIQGLANNTALTPAVQQQLLGEALFVRGLCYFYLVSLYNSVPLVTGTNYRINDTISRAPSVSVWAQIISDLQTSENLLSPSYLDATILNPTNERVRPTKWAACALLARAYLYNSSWSQAEAQADSIIGNSGLYSLDTLNGVFFANSNEAIWQLQPTINGINTQDAQLFILPSSGPSTAFPVYLSPFLLDAFEIGDQRRLNWVDSVIVGNTIYYYPYKYKVYAAGSPVSEYQMVLRLGEQYLIRAEAEAQLGDLNDAVADLNVIRNRAGGIPLLSASLSQSQILTAIGHERQVELFTEWGNRWLDLKRYSQVNAVLGSPGGICAAKGGTWNSDWQLYPIQLSQLELDPNLVQNTGY